MDQDHLTIIRYHKLRDYGITSCRAHINDLIKDGRFPAAVELSSMAKSEEPGKRVEFDVWSRDRECFLEDPGPARGVAYPKKVQYGVFYLDVLKIDHEVCLMIECYDEDYFRRCSGFRPA